MAWWIIVGIVLAVFWLIGQIPVGVDAAYDKAFSLKLKIWFFPILLFPAKKKAKQKPKAKKPTAKKPKPDKKPQPKPDFDTLLSYAELALELLGDLRKKLVLNDLSLHVYFGGEDPAEQAIGYGRAWAVIGALLPILENTFVIKKRDIAPKMVSDPKKLQFDGRIVLTITIGRSISLALHALLGYFKIKDVKKGEENNESSSV